MRRIKTAAVCVAVFALTLSLLWLMLTLSALIPNEAIYDNMLESALTYKEKDAFSFEDVSHLYAVSDNYADTILLQISMNIGRGDPLISALDTKYRDGGELGESIGLYLSLTDDDTVPNVDYTRYWHGSAALIRLFHLFTDVDGIKTAGLCSVIILAAAVVLLLIRKKHYALAAAFALSCMAVRIWNVRLSLEYIPAFVIGFLICVLFLLFEEKGDRRLVYLSVIGGTSVAFFDFLTAETVTVLLPLILVTAVRARENRLGKVKHGLQMSLGCVTAWGLSYAAAFAVKWFLATLVTGENKFASALTSAGVRFVGDTADAGVDSTLLRIPMAIVSNISTMLGSAERVEPARVITALALGAMIVISLFYLFGKKYFDKTSALLLLIPGALVFVRFAFLSNHSYMHCFFTYRALISPVMAFLSVIVLNTETAKERKR